MLESPHKLRYSTRMVEDPFSDILKLTNAETVLSGGFTAGGNWAIRFPAMEKIKFSAIVKGYCWLCIDGEQAPVRAEAGDVFLLSAQQSFVLASDLRAVPIDAASVFTTNATKIAKLGDGDDYLQLGGFVRFNAISGALLADVLPPLIHVRATSQQATVLHWLIEQLIHEQVAELPGASLASTQLAQLMFVQIVRAHLETSGSLEAGLLRAISDPQIAPALRLMHGDPGRSWHLSELAQAVAMSRTSFAVRFKQAAGVAPLTYLTHWRMRLAERALREQDTPVADLARSLGYTSESAFSNAFKRITGRAPKRYRSIVRG
jgi:AraC-like DNA-binding protein